MSCFLLLLLSLPEVVVVVLFLSFYLETAAMSARHQQWDISTPITQVCPPVGWMRMG